MSSYQKIVFSVWHLTTPSMSGSQAGTAVLLV